MESEELRVKNPCAKVMLASIINKTNVPADLQSAGIEYKDLQSLVFERLFYSGYVAMAKIRFTEFLPSTGCHHSVCPHYRHLARP